MFSLRSSVLGFVAVLFLAAPSVIAQAPSLQQQIESQYVLTKPTADRTDLVSTGDLIVLKKDDLFMCSIVSALPSNNVYKGGKIHQSMFNKAKFFTASGNTPTVPTRMFVSGEKFYLTGVDIKDDGVELTLLCDVMNGKRYYSFLKFPFPKGTTPPADQMLSTIAEVIAVQPVSNEAPAPPPPSRTIALGQSKEQVAAILGQPTTTVKLSNKEIEYFPTMKVTFVEGKVADVQ